MTTGFAVPNSTAAEAGSARTVPSAVPQARSQSGRTKQRLVGIDVSRGLALLGMMAVHALVPFDENNNPNWVSYVATGNASAVFALVAGVGLSLTTGRAAAPWARARPTAASVGARALSVGLIGLLLGYASAEITSVILPYYAMMFILAIPLLFLRTEIVVVVGLLAAVAVPVLSQLVRPALPEATLENFSFIYLFDHPLAMLSELLVTGAYPALPWVAYISAGLVVGRLTLSSAKVARRMLVLGAALAVATTAASWWLLGPLGGRAALRLAAPGPLNADGDTVTELLLFGFDGTTPTGSMWWLASAAPHGATPLDLLRTVGIALAVLGATLLLGHLRAPRVRRAVQLGTAPLAAAGSMTLTLYAAHVVFMNSPLDQFSPVGGYVFQVAAVLLFAVGWRQAVGRGPLETAVTAAAEWAKTRAGRGASADGARLGGPGPAAAAPHQEASSWGDETRDQDMWSWWGEDSEESSNEAGGPRRTADTADEETWSWWGEGVEESRDGSADVAVAETRLGSGRDPDQPPPQDRLGR